ncbi:type II secretion protein F [Motilibacter sp. K478]|nr:type II secretion system F family protein [Motilibacter aurantiacus]NHC44345.1 type II secretion protein F [Motilibacter aurantiacus]
MPVLARPGVRLPAVALVGVAAAVLVGGVLGAALGTLVAAGAYRLLADPRLALDRAGLARESGDAVAAADLLAACLAAGCPLEPAVLAVADAVGGPVAGTLREAVLAVRLGADRRTAWLAAGTARPALAPLARAVSRSATSGAPLAPTVSRVADEQRAERRWRAEAAAARVGTRAALPLALCFLPAFVLVGVVPVVLGVAGPLLGAA